MSADTDRAHMQRALALAVAARDQGEVPIGALLVDRLGRVLAESANRPIADCDPSAHAEILVLRAAGRRLANYRLPGTTLYVTLEPCAMCAGALVHARVERLVFGASDPRAGACGAVFDIVRDPRLNHRVEVNGGVLEAESAALLRAFFRARREQAGPEPG